MTDDRSAWTSYAESQGLVRSLQPVVTNDPKPNKFHAVRTIVDGVTFASKKEAVRYRALCAWRRAGVITDLKCQPSYPLHIMEIWRSGTRITTVGTFTADFEYLNLETGEIVVEDVKSPATAKGEAYRLRKKLVEAIHGLTVTEV